MIVLIASQHRKKGIFKFVCMFVWNTQDNKSSKIEVKKNTEVSTYCYVHEEKKEIFIIFENVSKIPMRGNGGK